MDRVTDTGVRRINLIVYANYGESNARIILGRDYDYPDLRTHAHNETIQACIHELVHGAREVIEDKEGRQVSRIKGLIREYHRNKSEKAKRALEESNSLFPFLFSRAWSELKREKEAVAETTEPEDVHYPMDPALRERVLDIERLIDEIGKGVDILRLQGDADDILVQTCRKLTARAREALAGRQGSAFTARRLDLTRASLTTTWRQIQGRLR